MKKPGAALFLSFLIPGLGLFYAGYVRKFITVNLFIWFMVFTTRNLATNFIVFCALVAIMIADHLYGLILSYKAAKNPLLSGYDKWWAYLIIVLVNLSLGTMLVGPNLDKLTRVNYAVLPTPIMEPNIHVGDKVAIVKNEGFERANISTFWFPPDPKTMYMSRCVGLPGDSISVVDGRVLINDVPNDIESLKHQYLIVTKDDRSINHRIFQQLGVNDFMNVQDGYLSFLSMDQVAAFRKFEFVEKVEPYFANIGIQGNPFNWSPNKFGPLLIPKKGDKIFLTSENIAYYKDYILAEDSAISFNGIYLVRGEDILDQYEFLTNYYFMMGDNRANSLDSRYWGLVPENLMIGNVKYIFWSEDFSRIGIEF